MHKVADAVRHTIEKDGFLHFGLANGVLNLTRTAKFIRPFIEARTKKEVGVSAITMALSRLKLPKRKMNAHLKNVKVNSVNVKKGLAEITYEKTSMTIQALKTAEESVRKTNGYIALTFSDSEITVISETRYLDAIKQIAEERPKSEIHDLVAVGVQFDEKYIKHAGMIYALIQQIAFQNINIVELSSTYTELVFYVHTEDMKLAFDTLYEQFM
jgi:aspartokinase